MEILKTTIWFSQMRLDCLFSCHFSLFSRRATNVAYLYHLCLWFHSKQWITIAIYLFSYRLKAAFDSVDDAGFVTEINFAYPVFASEQEQLSSCLRRCFTWEIVFAVVMVTELAISCKNGGMMFAQTERPIWLRICGWSATEWRPK